MSSGWAEGVDRFLRGARAAPNGGAEARLLSLSAAERRDILEGLWALDWWLRGRLMRSPGYTHEREASAEERGVIEGLRALARVFLPDSPPPSSHLFRAVALPPVALPPGGLGGLPGRRWRTGKRPLQSWTDSLESACAFAASLSGRCLVEADWYQFVVEASVPAGDILLRHGDMGRYLDAVVGRAADLAAPADVRGLRRSAERCLEVLRELDQREVIVALPGGEALVIAVHPC